MSAYGADKYGCELHGSVASHVHAVPNCGFRFFNVYGPRQDPHSPYSGVITIFANRLSVDQPLTINGDGYHSRDFIYVGDVVRGLLAGMDHCAATRTASDVFNICTGVETSIIDLAEALGEVFNRTPKIIYGPLRLGDLRRSVGCPLKARRVLDLCAETSLASGLAQTFSPGALNNRRQTRAA
jgi:UDP-glucose 4-epimerase